MATKEDARLIIEFSRWAIDWGFHEANVWIAGHAADVSSYQSFVETYPPGTPEHRHPFTVLGYFENLGLFYKHNVIDEALLFDWLDFCGPWNKLSSFAYSHREDKQNPQLWGNFEALAQAQRRSVSH